MASRRVKLVFFYLLCLSDVLKSVEVNYRCTEGWWNFKDRCYRILNSRGVYKHEATDVCTTGKSQLFVPSSSEEYNAVVSYINSLGPVLTPYFPTALDIIYFWIGCDDEEEEGTFRCTDGTTFNSTSVGWWKDGEPSNGEGTAHGNEDCVIYRKDQGIEDYPCNLTYFRSQVLCEAPAAITRSSTYSASPLSNRCLRGYTQKTIHKKSKTRCAAECLKEDFCVSFNFKDGVCDLNYSKRSEALYSAFQEEEGCSYYEP